MTRTERGHTRRSGLGTRGSSHHTCQLQATRDISELTRPERARASDSRASEPGVGGGESRRYVLAGELSVVGRLVYPGCSAASLASTHWMLTAPLASAVTTKRVCRHCRMSRRGQKCPPLKKRCSFCEPLGFCGRSGFKGWLG